MKQTMLLALPVLLCSFPVFAAPVLNSGDTAFMFITASLVLLMTLPGLALFYGGMAQSKNVLSVLTQVFSVTALTGVIFVLYGYSFSFTDGHSLNPVIGSGQKVFLRNITTDSLTGTVPEYVYVFFMLTFAAITPALITGAFAERIRFSSMLVFITLWATINYIPLAHMAWGGGWIAALSVQDFAGGDVVHINSGVAALTAAIMIGRRQQFRTSALIPHNMTMTMTGGSLLMLGWLGFCGGCALAANGYSMLVILNTLLGGFGGALSWMLLEWRIHKRPGLLGIITGAVAGMVGITPACGYTGPAGAICVGLLTAPVCLFFIGRIKQRLNIDDAFDVFAIHGIGGIVGGILTPVFALTLLGGSGFSAGRHLTEQLLVNVGVILFTLVFSALTSWIALMLAAKICGGLRTSRENETEGLDITEHGETGYRFGNN
ncbi:ammonium transporter [Tatumella sp. JGM130]|uniref:ammonium transporter n=1 Tax=Tatumella sp. JGM130 TaxID=2799797 RepID=UPI0020135264|nr:ammonium transporter [Tatumella sp. JGM130]